MRDHGRGLSNKADFTQTATVKTAVRKLAAPIGSLTSFTALVQDILDNNP
ncbi:hypothetical protein [uncultured Methanospirillum sp.]|nr:hypothetical protein [uncultured Methanospirillum sp.]